MSKKVVNMSEFIRMLRFVLFSISAGIIEYTSFAMLKELIKLSWELSYLIALILSILWNFTLNRKFTFRSANNIPIAMLKVAAYYVVFTPLSTWLGHYLADILLWNQYIVTAICMLLNFITEFLYQRYFVFGKSIDTNIKEQRE